MTFTILCAIMCLSVVHQSTNNQNKYTTTKILH
nr:MAG TPA: hypothetical protein [Caudoviricetes sp.]